MIAPISLTIDGLARAIYIRFSNNKIKKTVEPFAEVFVDLDYRGNVVGIEMINPGEITIREMQKISRKFHVPQFHHLVETAPKEIFSLI